MCARAGQWRRMLRGNRRSMTSQNSSSSFLSQLLSLPLQCLLFHNQTSRCVHSTCHPRVLLSLSSLCLSTVCKQEEEGEVGEVQVVGKGGGRQY